MAMETENLEVEEFVDDIDPDALYFTTKLYEQTIIDLIER